MTEPKTTGKKAGSIGQWGTTLGGGSKHSNAQTASTPASQLPEQPAVQASSVLDAQPPEHLAIKAAKPLRNKRTVYLEVETDRWIRHRIADTGEEISDVINIAIRLLMNTDISS